MIIPPHLLYPLTVVDPRTGDSIASDDMRQWMELISRTVSYSEVSSSKDLTTSGSMFIHASASINIELNPDAVHDDSVTVYRDTVAGNVRVFDSTGEDIIIVDQTVISYRFKDTLGWVRGA